MGAFSIWHWLIVLVVVLILFGGGGKITKLMGDFAKGLKSFKKNIKEENDGVNDAEPYKAIASEASEPPISDRPEASKDRAPGS